MTRHDMTVTRRLFLQTTAAAGGGLMLGGFVPGLSPAAEAAGVFEPNVWLKITADGKAVRSCQTTVGDARGKKVTTIEGLAANSDHPLQKAWIAEQAPQCGYCQSGMLMTAAALLAEKPKPTDAQIDQAMTGNVCRCGTYQRIHRAIARAARA